MVVNNIPLVFLVTRLPIRNYCFSKQFFYAQILKDTPPIFDSNHNINFQSGYTKEDEINRKGGVVWQL